MPRVVDPIVVLVISFAQSDHLVSVVRGDTFTASCEYINLRAP